MSLEKSNRLFVITNNTHFQIILNYIENHPVRNNYIILTITPFEGYKIFLEEVIGSKLKLLGSFINNQVDKFPVNYYKLWKNYFGIKKLNLSHYCFEQVIFSNYDSLLQHIVLAETKIIKPVLISDGVAIFKILDLRTTTSEARLNSHSFFIKKVFKIKPFKQIHFFSPVDLPPPKNDTIEIFAYNKNINFEIVENLIYFVDSPLVERDFVNIEKKIQYLHCLKNKFPDKKFIYFAHRRERDENLIRYKFFGEIRKDSVPFEERLKIDKYLPKIIISFISSILINLPINYPNIEFRYLILEKDDIIDRNFEMLYFNLLNNFKLIKSKNLKLLDLSNKSN